MCIIEDVLAKIKGKTGWDVDCKKLIDFCQTHNMRPTDYSQPIRPLIDNLFHCPIKYRQFVADTILFMLVDELAVLPPSIIPWIIAYGAFDIPSQYNDYSIPQRLVIHGMLNFSPWISSLTIEHNLIKQLFDSPSLWEWIRGKKLSTQQWLNSCHFTAHANIFIARIPTVIHAIIATHTYISNAITKTKSSEEKLKPILQELTIMINQLRINKPSDSSMLSDRWNKTMQMFFACSCEDFELITYKLPGWWHTSALISLPEIFRHFLNGKHVVFSGYSLRHFDCMYNWKCSIPDRQDIESDLWLDVWKSGLCIGTTVEKICNITIHHTVVVRAVIVSEKQMFQVFDPLKDDVLCTQDISNIELSKC